MVGRWMVWLLVSGWTQPDAVCRKGDPYYTWDATGYAHTNAGQPNYENSIVAQCQWAIAALPTDIIQLHIYGSTAGGGDVLTVCPSAVSGGSGCHNLFGARDVTFTGGLVALQFSTDASGTDIGYAITWRKAPLPGPAGGMRIVRLGLEEEERGEKRAARRREAYLLVELFNGEKEPRYRPFSVQWYYGQSSVWRMVKIAQPHWGAYKRMLVKIKVKKALGRRGKVALVDGTVPLGCGHSCSGDGSVIDFVGFGENVEDWAGNGPAPRILEKKGIVRVTSTGDNSKDWKRKKSHRYVRVIKHTQQPRF